MRGALVRVLLGLLALGAVAAWLVLHKGPEGCVPGPRGVAICVASDLAKLPNHGRVPLEAWLFDPHARRITLEAARDETVAFQVVLRSDRPRKATVEVGDLRGGSGVIPAAEGVRRFLASYVRVDPGGHTWGPKSAVLPWPDLYPDALVPFRAACTLGQASPTSLLESVAVPAGNQAVWIDLHVPRGATPGGYQGELSVTVEGERIALPIALEVSAATLPLRPALEAFGEIYDAYVREGAGKDLHSPAWQRMARCTQQLAHAHRAVFAERFERAPGPEDWAAYDAAFGEALSGKLFEPSRGYHGPGASEPVAVWRTPWPQPWSERLEGPLSDAEVSRYVELARSFVEHTRGAGRTRFFAYLFDEVDGNTDEAAHARDAGYLAMVHAQMRRVQAALDQGGARIDLLWTSHQNPKAWAGDPRLDLQGVIRAWAPNAAAADPAFLRARLAAGEHAWFYHAGHPSVGTQVINASGIELRSWGVIAARYGLGGVFVWAVNFGDPAQPFAHPSYKAADDRFGNGTLIYPGAALPRLGFPSIDEPVPSMRLKALRRGLFDADLAEAARQCGSGAEVDRLLATLVPRALAEGAGKAAWPSDPGRWNAMHHALLRLASCKR